MADGRSIENSRRSLQHWLEERYYAGIEPHDALTSPLIQRTPLRRSSLVRLAALQALRRMPVDVRPALGVRRAVNPVSLGWALSAYALIGGEQSEAWVERALTMLRESEPRGYSGAAWGYYFDWQTRAGFKRAHLPIIVSTAFVGIGLLDAWKAFGRNEYYDYARSACRFILRDLNREMHPEGFCFSYSPDDREQVFNASILGADLLARVGAVSGDGELLQAARDAVDFVVAHQREDGSWGYALGDYRTFVDNFHTGYVLNSLRGYIRASGDERHAGALAKGYRFYREHFFEDERIPKYYHNQLYPIDAHAASESIITLVNFGDVEAALRVAEWTIEHMQTPQGYFIYQIHRRFTNRIAYLRWSNARMLYALVKLEQELKPQ